MFSVTRHARTRSHLLAGGALLAATILLTGCAASTQPETSPGNITAAEAQLLQAHDLSGLDAEAIIDRLDQTTVASRPTDLSAQIRSEELMLSDADGREASLPMPAGRTYVAFAPYVQQTHECTYHAPVGCIGEMANAPVHVTVVDQDNGTVYLDEDTKTYDNGFVGVWLPREITASVTITAGDQHATTTVSTADPNAATCITTMRLA